MSHTEVFWVFWELATREIRLVVLIVYGGFSSGVLFDNRHRMCLQRFFVRSFSVRGIRDNLAFDAAPVGYKIMLNKT